MATGPAFTQKTAIHAINSDVVRRRLSLVDSLDPARSKAIQARKRSGTSDDSVGRRRATTQIEIQTLASLVDVKLRKAIYREARKVLSQKRQDALSSGSVIKRWGMKDIIDTICHSTRVTMRRSEVIEMWKDLVSEAHQRTNFAKLAEIQRAKEAPPTQKLHEAPVEVEAFDTPHVIIPSTPTSQRLVDSVVCVFSELQRHDTCGHWNETHSIIVDLCQNIGNSLTNLTSMLMVDIDGLSGVASIFEESARRLASLTQTLKAEMQRIRQALQSIAEARVVTEVWDGARAAEAKAVAEASKEGYAAMRASLLALRKRREHEEVPSASLTASSQTAPSHSIANDFATKQADLMIEHLTRLEETLRTNPADVLRHGTFSSDLFSDFAVPELTKRPLKDVGTKCALESPKSVSKTFAETTSVACPQGGASTPETMSTNVGIPSSKVDEAKPVNKGNARFVAVHAEATQANKRQRAERDFEIASRPVSSPEPVGNLQASTSMEVAQPPVIDTLASKGWRKINVPPAAFTDHVLDVPPQGVNSLQEDKLQTRQLFKGIGQATSASEDQSRLVPNGFRTLLSVDKPPSSRDPWPQVPLSARERRFSDVPTFAPLSARPSLTKAISAEHFLEQGSESSNVDTMRPPVPIPRRRVRFSLGGDSPFGTPEPLALVLLPHLVGVTNDELLCTPEDTPSKNVSPSPLCALDTFMARSGYM